MICRFFFFFPSRLCCPLRFQNFPQTGWWEGFLVFGNFSFMKPSPGWVSTSNSFVSVFIFYILSYLLLKRMGCLSDYLVSSTSIQNLLCGSCSAFKWSFNEFVGEKVVSLFHASTILGPPPFIPLFDFFFCFVFLVFSGWTACVFWKLFLCQLFNLLLFSFWVLSFHLIYSFLFCAKAFKFNWIPLVYFCFYFHYSRRWVVENLALIYVIECSAYIFF